MNRYLIFFNILNAAECQVDFSNRWCFLLFFNCSCSLFLFSRNRSRFKIILTGTPVQNNLGEMYCLLSYLCPRIFDNKEVFDDCFSLDPVNIVVDRKTLADAHYMLRTFILRRLKTEVEVTLPSKLETLVRCPLSEMQKFWTRQMLTNDTHLLDRLIGNESGERAQNCQEFVIGNVTT
jgi:SNF2 family DNA or RNA helicase